MQSAFGVEHGEISKIKRIFPVRPRGARIPGSRANARRPTQAQKQTAGQGPPTPTRTAKAKGVLHRIGEADISLKGVGGKAGGIVRGTGKFLETHPGLTGTAVVGGGGAAGYHYLRNKEPKR